MPKIFLSSIGVYQLGPMGSPIQGIGTDVKNWNSRKSISVSLKDFFYYIYVARFKASGNLSYSTTSEPFDIGCAGDQYCKGQITSVNNTQYSVKTSVDYKTADCNERTPKCNTKEVTTLELMFFYANSWKSKIESKYRVKNSLGGCPDGPNIRDCSTKQRNCCQDVKYEWDGEKWVRIVLSENPDTTFTDYTYIVNSYIRIYLAGSGGLIFLDDSNYIFQNFMGFDGDSLYLSYPSDYNPQTCEKFNGKGTLTAAGKTVVNPYLYGQPCGTKGQAFLTTSWTPSSKLNLI